jgi:hypothetical protein
MLVARPAIIVAAGGDCHPSAPAVERAMVGKFLEDFT